MFLRFMSMIWPFFAIGCALSAVVDLCVGDFLGAIVGAFMAWAGYEGGKWIDLTVKLDSLK